MKEKRHFKPIHISNILEDSFKGLGLQNRLVEYRISRCWKDAVGAKISEKARPSRLIGNTLYINVISSPWMQELNLLKGVIIDKLNRKLGEKTIDNIIFKKTRVLNDLSSRKNDSTSWDKISISKDVEEGLRERLSFLKDQEIRDVLFRILFKDEKVKSRCAKY